MKFYHIVNEDDLPVWLMIQYEKITQAQSHTQNMNKMFTKSTTKKILENVTVVVKKGSWIF